MRVPTFQRLAESHLRAATEERHTQRSYRCASNVRDHVIAGWCPILRKNLGTFGCERHGHCHCKASRDWPLQCGREWRRWDIKQNVEDMIQMDAAVRVDIGRPYPIPMGRRRSGHPWQ